MNFDTADATQHAANTGDMQCGHAAARPPLLRYTRHLVEPGTRNSLYHYLQCRQKQWCAHSLSSRMPGRVLYFVSPQVEGCSDMSLRLFVQKGKQNTPL